MSGEREFDDLIAKLERDVARTVGATHVALVREVVALNDTLHLDEHLRAEKSIHDAQQALHDAFVDTTWPACPHHAHHPLWYRDGAWWCDQDQLRVADLGALGDAMRRG